MAEKQMTANQVFAEGVRLRDMKDYPGAIAQFERILLTDELPDRAGALSYNERGAALQKLGHYFDAILNYERAISLWPENAAFQCNLGSAYFEIARFDRAMKHYDRTLEMDPTIPEAQLNRANVFLREGKTEKSRDTYLKAIELRHEYPDAWLGLAVSNLKLGNYKEGWEQFEWRWKTDQLPPRNMGLPEWDGSAAQSPDQVILIYTEQGHGDALQFCRYCELVKEVWKGKVYVECRLPLARLMRSVPGVDHVIVLSEKITKDAVCCAAMMSLPRILGTTVETIPAKIPYIGVDQGLVAHWRKKLTALPPSRLLVGVCWAGMNRSTNLAASAIDARRSMNLAQMAELARVPGISWVSLQKGTEEAQVARPPYGMTIGDWVSEFEDFADTAAVISCLDLVITVDTAIAHVSAALGKPTWMMNRFDTCWRWFDHEREDSPWYPGVVRLFTQTTPGDWDGVLVRVAKELNDLPRKMAARAA
jgi:TPR repeat/Glycosyltransferase family 9 (heptosyltransferase)